MGGLTESERAWQQRVTRRLRGVPLVLDFQHVLAKLWSAVYAVPEEGNPKALAWVQERAWRLLHGEVSQVVQGMRVSVTKRQLRRLLGFETRFDVHAFLKEHAVPLYTLNDLQHDRKTLHQLGI